MAVFVANKTVTQKDPQVQVEVTPTAPLPLGVNRFQLIVVDDSGNQSVAATIDVMVKDTTAPTAAIIMVNADGKRIDPPVVSFGQSFFLSGAPSTDAGGGKIVEYRFTLLGT
jgi:hypothetical protein